MVSFLFCYLAVCWKLLVVAVPAWWLLFIPIGLLLILMLMLLIAEGC